MKRARSEGDPSIVEYLVGKIEELKRENLALETHRDSLIIGKERVAKYVNIQRAVSEWVCTECGAVHVLPGGKKASRKCRKCHHWVCKDCECTHWLPEFYESVK